MNEKKPLRREVVVRESSEGRRKEMRDVGRKREGRNGVEEKKGGREEK